MTEGDDARTFEEHRAALLGHAYRMLGEVAEAEDVVQDAFLKWHGAERGEIRNARAFLMTVVTRLCLTRLRSARRRREAYVGPWLPEPFVGGADTASPEEALAHDVSVALMLALERLTPLERAAFLLHDVFDVGFAEVGSALGREEAACRQLAARARAHLKAERPRHVASLQEAGRVSEAFFAALDGGKVDALREVLVDTATMHADGGGVRTAALRPVVGADRIARFFAGLVGKGRIARPLWSRSLRINGLPGRLSVEADGGLQTLALAVEEGRVAAIYIVRNPDKLAHLEALLPPELQGSGGRGLAAR